MTASKSKPGGFVTLLLVVLGLYLTYVLILFLAKVFVFTGYNFFFFTDNLLEIKSFHPLVNWGILGLLLGSIAGVAVAIKKYGLSKLLIIYPVGVTAVYVTVMWALNNPAAYTGNLYVPPATVMDTVAAVTKKVYYRINALTTARSGPSGDDEKLFQLRKRTEVELISRQFFDAKHIEWYKIKYKDQEGFVNAKYLRFSRTADTR